MEILNALLGGLGGGGIVAGLTVWWIKGYLNKQLDLHFGVLTKHASISARLRRRRLEAIANVLPLLQNTATKARNELRQVVSSGAIDSSTLAGSLDDFQDLLYGTQLLLSPLSYELSHRYMRILEFAIQQTNAPLDGHVEFPKLPQLHDLLLQLEGLHPQLQSQLRAELARTEDIRP
jgi:hypothetical protein